MAVISELVFENFVSQSGFKWLSPVKDVHSFLNYLKDEGYWVHLF